MLTIAAIVIAIWLWPITLVVLAVMYWPVTLFLLVAWFALYVLCQCVIGIGAVFK